MKIKDFFASPYDPAIVPDEWWLERYRAWRESELTQCDWTQLPDSTASKTTWAEYRQELRDLPAVDDFANAELPTRPE